MDEIASLNDLPAPSPDFERLLDVLLRRRKPDVVPLYELFVNGPIMEAALGEPVPDRAATLRFYHRAGYDYVPAWPRMPIATGSLIDRRKGYPVTDRGSFERFPWPSPKDISFDEFPLLAPLLPAGMRIVGQTGGIFELAQSICGLESLCWFLADDRPLFGELFARIGALYEVIYEGMARAPAVGALVISDDLGYKTQTMLPPAVLREFVFPRYARLAAIAHDHGKPCILHSCGNLAAVMDDLIDGVRIDAKHSYEDAIVPVEEFRRRYGGRVAVLGGFDVDRLCRLSPEGVAAETRRMLETLGRTGGYAFGSGNSIADFVPVPNYLAMLAAYWRHRLP